MVGLIKEVTSLKDKDVLHHLILIKGYKFSVAICNLSYIC